MKLIQNSNFRVQGMLFSTQKFISQILGTFFKQGFLIMKLIQNRNFRVFSVLLSTIVLCYTYIWKSCACISYYPAIISPRIYATISVIKKLQHNFPKMRRGLKTDWKFSENSSDLVAWPIPIVKLLHGFLLVVTWICQGLVMSMTKTAGRCGLRDETTVMGNNPQQRAS